MFIPAQSSIPAARKATPFSIAWSERKLLFRLARREVEARYRGTFLSLLWTVLLPLLTLSVYTFVFAVVFEARWDTPVSHKGDFALITFAGLLLFSFFAECLNRAPGLMLENVAYIKKVVFPLEILPLVSVGVALFNLAIGSLVLAIFFLIIRGVPPFTVVLAPVIAAPLVLLAIGVSYFLSSLGVFLRDVRQVVGVVTTLLMFLSPIFYPVSAIPEQYRTLLYLNPLALLLDYLRKCLFSGSFLSTSEWIAFGWLTIASWLFAWGAFWWFQKTKKAFADVV